MITMARNPTQSQKGLSEVVLQPTYGAEEQGGAVIEKQPKPPELD